ncbi:hypothetical protein QBC44DRAFT_64945 [Cladorrhinum sp. PSN332]|nr:hypothetical protein QBC44DRAFT_64945 [Cladorrhinum sp. PSN332]
MSPSYDSRRRGVWSHWVPLIATVTVATVGAAAWVWSQRKSNEEAEDADLAFSHPDLDYEHADHGDNPAYGTSDGPNQPSYGATQNRSGDANYETASSPWAALRRSPSPQQFLDSARRTVAAGVTAAGAAVGSALAAIREEDKTATIASSSQAQPQRPSPPQSPPQPQRQPKSQSKQKSQSRSKSQPQHQSRSQSQPQSQSQSQPQSQSQAQSKDANKRRKKVAIVISADNHLDDVDADGFHEHASILSHIPRKTDFSNVKLYILIYAPNLKDTVRETTSNLPPPSLSSSFSNIEYSQTPGDESKSPLVGPSAVDPAYNAIYAQAQGLVEKDSMILTYTTPNGHSHILRHIQPEIVYLQESLSGENGSVVTNLQTWLRHDIILVVGAESGHGGLADSESENEKPGKADDVWWHREDRVGRGRGVVVVDGMRVQDDWARRILGKE